MSEPTRDVAGPDRRTRRGRPSAGDSVDRRAALVEAARRQFAARGYAGASLRSIAREAGVDPSLVSHHFGDKQALLVATLALPVDPPARVREVLDGPLDGMGERLVRTFVSTWDAHREAFATVARTAVAGDMDSSPVATLVRSVVVDGFARRLTGADVELRASLIASQVLGLGIARYVAHLEPLASASAEDLVLLHGPAVQALIDG